MNNDGNIVAVCPIAKRLGIPKFEPIFKIRNLLEQHNVVLRSSNYELYAHISRQMMNTIARYCDNSYVYSIDECFGEFTDFTKIISDWYRYGHQIRRAVWKECRMPVGVGFGPTLTLAKAANHASKKLPGADGVACIDDEHSRIGILRQMSLTDVWGVGSRLSNKLAATGVKNAYELSKLSPKRIRSEFSVVLERTINELNGMQCLTWNNVREAKKQIFSTHSFGKRVNKRNALKQALSSHVDKVVFKSSEQCSLIKKLVIFASNSPHDEHFYSQSVKIEFPNGTGSLLTICNALDKAIDKIFHPNVNFYRCGVGAIELVSKTHFQPDLFLPAENTAVMDCYAKINQRFGAGTIKNAASTGTGEWKMRREHLSNRYTSSWADIPRIRC